MKRCLLVIATSLLADVLLVPSAQAQTCPANRLQLLTGQWAFSIEGFTRTPDRAVVSAGRFVANAQGLLSITASSNIQGSPVRLETDAGRFQVSAGCKGGTLTFNLSSRPMQFDFFFAGPDEIILIGSNNGDIVRGSAKRVAPAACPADRLLALAGDWSFSIDGFFVPAPRFLAWVGRFTASVGSNRTGAPIGELLITSSSSADGSPVRLETDAGRYQINADCTGGTLTFNLSSRPMQFDFVFTAQGQIAFVSTNHSDILVGSARLAAPQTVLLPPGPHFGQTYSDWSVLWWRWFLSLPVSKHPAFGTADCSTGQVGSVWFLFGLPGPATVNCTVPSGKALFFPLINAECSNVEPPPFFGATEAARRACAQGLAAGATNLTLSIDGVPVSNLAGFRTSSPNFLFTAPPDNAFGVPSGIGEAVDEGYYVMLAPLAPGAHVIRFTATFPVLNFTIDTTYMLTVTP